MKKVLCSCLIFLCSFQVVSEDIELYVGEVSQRTGNKPQVLIIFDNSGSMSKMIKVKQQYDPNTDYPALGSDNSLNERFTYFVKGAIDGTAPVPDGPSEQRRFSEKINGCNTAVKQLKEKGFYTGYLREYTYKGNTGSWQEIPDSNGANIEVLDCWEDVLNKDPTNANFQKSNGTYVALPDGYPVDGAGSKQSPQYYTPDISGSNTKMGTGEVVTLYTDNYLRWYHNAAIPTEDSNRLAVAQTTIKDLIYSAPAVDFGLQIFNLDYPNEGDRDGGRVIFGIQNMTDTVRASYASTIDSITADTNTPLCETLYEASRYFGGKSVQFGDDDSNYQGINYKGNKPSRDLNIENNGVYKSPFTGCSNQIYVILITDGEPTLDSSADSEIASLKSAADPALTSSPYTKDGKTSSLNVLAEWMNTNDINPTLDGNQHANIYTVGFSEGADAAAGLLTETAKVGGGKYYKASDSVQLLSSLQSALIEILKVNSSFTSPSVASDNFDRTRTLDAIYYTMFLPDNGPRWRGNLKKLKLKDDKQVDREGNSAIDDKGNISANAKTFWSTATKPDGNEVKLGGVSEMMIGFSGTRKIYSDLGGLKAFNSTNLQSQAGDLPKLASHFGVPEAEVETYIKWAIGEDVDDEDQDNSTTDNRQDIFGDPLHSKPLVLNYGGTAASQDVRILVGTNAGAFHMFKDSGSTVTETWAFYPYELLPNIRDLRTNNSTSNKIYGVDGTAVSYIDDSNGDGTIGSNDKAWVFFGLRRGGSSYYALDVTEKDKPTFKWKITPATTGFEKLGQTWSKPTVTHIKNPGTGTVTPVLVFGGGYSVNKDADGVGKYDIVGNAIYIVNADTGALIWSASKASTSSKNLQVDFNDSIPSSIAVMDSDFDGIADRLYFGDTGGNVWRTDMPGQNPFDSKKPWTVVKLASLGSELTNTDDLRFFNEPSIARSFTTVTTKDTVVDGGGNSTTNYSRVEKPFEAILIGSGDRTSPANTETANKFFMIRDDNIITQSWTTPPTPIGVSDLYSFTSNPLQDVTGTLRDELDVAVSSKKGWYMDLTDKGEKSLSSATVIAGVAYFNSFTPSDKSATTTNSNSCELASGGGSLYAVDLHDGTNVYSWRKLDIGDKVPDTPTVIVSPTEPDKLLFVGVGEGEGDGVLILCPADQDCDRKPKPPCPEGQDCGDDGIVSLKTMRTNLYVTEKK